MRGPKCLDCHTRTALPERSRCLSCYAALIRRVFGLDTMAGRTL